MLVGPKRKEEAVIIVEDEDEDEKESVRRRRRRRRRRKQRKVKESKERNAERMESILQALESIQMDLEAVNIKAGKAFLRLKRKFIQMRRPFLERRDLIIQHIPGFWVKAVSFSSILMGQKPMTEKETWGRDRKGEGMSGRARDGGEPPIGRLTRLGRRGMEGGGQNSREAGLEMLGGAHNKNWTTYGKSGGRGEA